MKVKVRFFASLKEQFGQDSLEETRHFRQQLWVVCALICVLSTLVCQSCFRSRAFACSGEPRSPTAHREAETAKAHRG